MSNEYEFKVHNFYNYTHEELPAFNKDFEASVSQFDNMYEHAIYFTEAQAALNNSPRAASYKHTDGIEDATTHALAEEHHT